MKLKDPLAGDCKHGIPKKELCEKCWAVSHKQFTRQTERVLKVFEMARNLGRKSTLQFD